MNRSLICVAIAAALSAVSFASVADPVTISTPFMNLENRAINSDSFGSGEYLRIGANSVVPNGNAGTTGIGTTTDLASGAAVTRTINFSPGPIIPNFFDRYIAASSVPDITSLYGPWTLTFTNGGDTASTVVTLPPGTTQAPFVNTITLSGTSAAPTFSWTPPANTTVNAYRVNIYDKSLINENPANGPLNNGQVASRNFLSGTTSYTVNPADFTVPGYAFQLGKNYSIEIGLIQTKDGTSNASNSNIEAISRVYADFQPSQSNGPPVNLPVTLVNGSYQFNISVVPGQTYYIDPLVATGYDYRIGAGNPSFASVVLPIGIGDGRYDIFGLDASNNATLLAQDWLGGTVFNFGGTGVNAFRIGGIETSAGLDPANVTAFVTGLTFEGSGFFTGTQTPLTADVAAIPEPETLGLLAAGLAMVAARTRRRRSR